METTELFITIGNKDILLKDAPSDLLLEKINYFNKKPTEFRNICVNYMRSILLNRKIEKLKNIINEKC